MPTELLSCTFLLSEDLTLAVSGKSVHMVEIAACIEGSVFSSFHFLLLVTIRTSYDTANKQHWLSVYRQKLACRFLLKDTSMTKSQTFSVVNSADKQIREVTDQMIAAIQDMEHQRRPKTKQKV